MKNESVKTIGVFINRPELDWQRKVCAALCKYAVAAGYRILFFTCNEIRESKDLYNYYNEVIVMFAPLEKLDAIIVAFDTFDIPSFRMSLVKDLKARASCPVISIREHNADFYSVLNGTNETIAALIHHLHEEHGAKRIFFEAGYEGHYDSEEREKVYHEEMKKLGLPEREQSVFHGDMWTRAGEDAYRHFYSDPSFLPEAIVCANDFMARALAEALIAHGVRIPEDVMITGVDNEATATDYEPHLTTITDDVDLVMKETVALITDLLAGKKRERVLRVPTKVLLRESCGCGRDEAEDDAEEGTSRRHFVNFNHLAEQISLESFFRVDINGCESLEEIRLSVKNHLNILGDVRSFYLCLLGSCGDNEVIHFSEQLSEKALLAFGVDNGEDVPFGHLVFQAADLLPEKYIRKEPCALYVTMLHDRSRCFGYTVTEMRHLSDGLDRFFHSWNLSVGFAVANLFAQKEIRLLSKKNEYNSVTDSMTELRNRRGLEGYMERVFTRTKSGPESLTVLSVDLDGLKSINDLYGHRAGDEAICAAADCIRAVLPPEAVAARVGGDEFMIVLPAEGLNIGALTAAFEKEIAKKNAENDWPFTLSASVGAASAAVTDEDSYEALTSKSDAEMYRVKKAKKSRAKDRQIYLTDRGTLA